MGVTDLRQAASMQHRAPNDGISSNWWDGLSEFLRQGVANPWGTML